MRKTLAATAAALALAASLPLIATADEHRGQGMGGPGMHMGPGGPGMHMGPGGDHGGPGMRHRRHGLKRLMKLIDRFDADGDGSVTQAEIDAGRAARLKAFDKDGDGKLSLAEYEALWLDAMREHMVDTFQSHDDDGDGQITVEEFGERTRHMVMMRDRNGDDALSIDDVRHGARGPRGHGRMRGRGDD